MNCLIVDDSEEYIASATSLLSLQGLRVLGGAPDGATAHRLAADLRPDVALVDVELGPEDGPDVATRLLASGLVAHAILISIRDGDELADAAGLPFLRKDALDARAVEALVAAGRPTSGPASSSGADGALGGEQQMTEIADLADGTHSAHATGLTGSTYPTGLTGSTDLADLTRSTRSTRLADPARLAQPTDLVSSAHSVDPADPTRLAYLAALARSAAVLDSMSHGTDLAQPPIPATASAIPSEADAIRSPASGHVPPPPTAAPAAPPSIAQLQALTRIAAAVARGAEPQAVFAAIAVEASRLLAVEAVSLIRYDPDQRAVTKVSGTPHAQSRAPEGAAWPLDHCPEAARVLRTGGPARVDDWSVLTGPLAERHRDCGFGAAVAAPIMVDGEIWGLLAAYGRAEETLPAGCERDLAGFTDLMATAVASVQARVLAERQGALRRVATLVAEGAEPQAVFTAVAEQASRLLGVGAVSLIRCNPDRRTLTKIYGTHGSRSPVPDGSTWPLEQCPEAVLVLRTGGPARVDDWTDIPGPAAAGHRDQGFGQAVAAPIMVDGGVWGLLAAYGEADEVLAAGCERDLADFTDLVAIAIANVQVRDELRGLAERQGAALRRVATLVAQRAPSLVIFNSVAAEASRALGVPRVDIGRRHDDGRVGLLGSHGRTDPTQDDVFSLGGVLAAEAVAATGRAARIDDWSHLAGPEAAALAAEGYTSVAAAPIHVDGALWGVIAVLADQPLREDTATRLTDFTHLVAGSISNVHARDSLIASRARIVTAGDDTRRRIERNLHDGIQQRVVALSLSLRAVRMRYPLAPDVVADLDELAHDLDSVLEEIRVFSQGLHPALLSRSGLGPSLRDLTRRSPVPVELDVPGGRRFPEPVETAVYYLVSEALANAVKHAGASVVTVAVEADAHSVRAVVADDGVGGAVLGRGTGLTGLVDRAEALGGRFTLDSPAGRGTRVVIELPLAARSSGLAGTLDG
ncbi:hypothetical protein GCM10009839_48400 [Catenulispora yoronensis]|uniref:histidine kinase n=1 Tax=Catenulispora yoronensis TaxID=450799 RepID=A0ABN2UN67_9ACTN